MPRVNADELQDARRVMNELRSPDLFSGDAPASNADIRRAALIVDAANVELLTQLKALSTLVRDMYISDKIEFSLAQEGMMKDAYGQARLAVALAEGTLCGPARSWAGGSRGGSCACIPHWLRCCSANSLAWP